MDEKRFYKVALISWPIKDKFPDQSYINLGEIYDRKLRENKIELCRFNKELSYLYPFRCTLGDSIVCHNIEDIVYFQKKYRLTVRIRTQGTFSSRTVTFRSPVLYDITNMRPIFRAKRKPKCENISKNTKVCVVLPYKDPVLRGKILDACLELGANNKFILLGDKQGKNLDSTSTLMSRYLLTRSVESSRLIKSCQDQLPDCILETIAIIDMMGIEDYILAIGVSSEDINDLSTVVRTWRKGGVLDENMKLTYITGEWQR